MSNRYNLQQKYKDPRNHKECKICAITYFNLYLSPENICLLCDTNKLQAFSDIEYYHNKVALERKSK